MKVIIISVIIIGMEDKNPTDINRRQFLERLLKGTLPLISGIGSLGNFEREEGKEGLKYEAVVGISNLILKVSTLLLRRKGELVPLFDISKQPGIDSFRTHPIINPV